MSERIKLQGFYSPEIFVTNTTSSPDNPCIMLAQAMSEAGFGVRVDVDNPRQYVGQKGRSSVAIVTESDSDRQAFWQATETPEYKALSEVFRTRYRPIGNISGQLSLDECGWDDSTKARVQASYLNRTGERHRDEGEEFSRRNFGKSNWMLEEADKLSAQASEMLQGSDYPSNDELNMLVRQFLQEILQVA